MSITICPLAAEEGRPYLPCDQLEALLGLLSRDGSVVVYSKLLGCEGMPPTSFQKYIPFPCSLIHDTDASAFAELWFCPNIKDAILFVFNRNFGGALILDREIYRGKEFTSGIIEHICIDPHGNHCYCGKQGCVGAFCSVNALLALIGEKLDDFFLHLRNNDPKRREIWNLYLYYIALSIDSIRMLIDCDFIFGGYLLPYFTESDIHQLEQMVRDRCAFSSTDFKIQRGRCGSQAPSIGAALLLIEEYLVSSGFNLERCKQKYRDSQSDDPADSHVALL